MSFLLTLLLLTCALSAHAKEGPSFPVPSEGFVTSDLEALMMTTMNVTGKDSSWSNATPACNWKGVECNTTGSVVSTDWYSMGLGGTPNLATLPRGLLQLYFDYNQFTGTPNLATLPQGLLQLGLSSNQFTGTPNLSTLPQGLQALYLGKNQFTGTPNLATLPQGLQALDMDTNDFDGSGSFFRAALWCPSTITTNMCGVGHNAIFDCPGKTWTCMSSGSNAFG